MKRFLILSAFSFGLAACKAPSAKATRDFAPGHGHSQSPLVDTTLPDQNLEEAWQALRRRFQAELNWNYAFGREHYKIPGGAMAIVFNGRLMFAEGFGSQDQKGYEPFEASTLVTVGSLSKMITAATILSLVEEGRLDLDRPINDYLQAAGHKFSRREADQDLAAHITLRHLLSHTSGIPDELPSGIDEFGPAVCGSGSDAYWKYSEIHRNDPLWAPPGALWNYSNPGFFLAAAVAVTVTNQSFEELPFQRVLRPTHMNTALWDGVLAEAHQNFSYGYDYWSPVGKKPELMTVGHASTPCRIYRPAAGLHASVIDFAQFAITFMAKDDAWLKPRTLELFVEPQVDTFDEGWRYSFGLYTAENYKGLKIIAHDGAAWGYKTILIMVPERQFAVIAFQNVGISFPNGLWDLAFEATDRFLDLPKVPQLPPELPLGQLEDLAGTFYGWTYDDQAYEEARPAYTELTVNIRFDPMTSQLSWEDDWFGAARLDLMWWPKFRVSYPDPSRNTAVRFIRNSAGVVEWLASSDFVGRRADERVAVRRYVVPSRNEIISR